MFTIPKCEYQAVMNEKKDAYHDICMRADTVLYWSPLIHLQVTEFHKKIKSGIALLKPETTPDPSPTVTPTSPDSAEATPVTPKSTLCFRFNKSFSIIGKLAKNHAVEISAGTKIYSLYKNLLSFQYMNLFLQRTGMLNEQRTI